MKWLVPIVVCAVVQIAHADVVVTAEPGIARDVAGAADGSRYVAGATTTRPGDGHLQPQLVALDPQGSVLWHLMWDGIGHAGAVAATPAGPVVLVRFLGGPFDADPGPESAPIDGDSEWRAVVVALTDSGALRWTWSPPRADLAALEQMPDGSVAIAGTHASGASFVAALDSAGTLRWHRQLGTAMAPHAMAVSSAGIFVTGIASGAGRTAVASPGAFVVRFELDGDRAWSRRLGSRGGISKGYAIAADNQRVVVGGLFRGRVDFDPGRGRQLRVSVDADDDGFVAAYDMTGELDWVYAYGAASSDQVRGVALEDQQVHVLGSQTDVVDLRGAVGRLEPETKWFLLTLDADAVPRTALPVVLGTARAYPGMYVGAMALHHDHLLIAGDVSRSSVIAGRSVTPVAGGASSARAVMIDLGPLAAR